jgi:glutamate racemase
MNVHDAPIGMFDSGLGGLSVALEVRRRLPAERLLYAADSRFCPYGSRSPEEIHWRSRLIAGALVERGIKLLIVACNTASAYAIEDLRERFAIPIIGMEPAVKPAVEASRNKRIGVLATPRTAASDRLQRLIERYAQNAYVHAVPAPGLVELVESGTTDSAQTRTMLGPLIGPLVEDGVDTIVLGCTHYPFLRDAIQNLAGDSMTLIDSGEAIARRTSAVLDEIDAHAERERTGGLDILTTGEPAQVAAVVSRLLSEIVAVEHLDLADVSGDYDPPAADSAARAEKSWAISSSAGA